MKLTDLTYLEYISQKQQNGTKEIAATVIIIFCPQAWLSDLLNSFYQLFFE